MSTESTPFAGYTLQQAYDITAAHLAKQKRRCMRGGVVVMRNKHRACPIGKLLPDHLYSEDIAHAHARDLPKHTIAAILPETPYAEAIRFLSAIEDVHDEACSIRPGKLPVHPAMAQAMAKEMRIIADRFNLDHGAEKKLAGIYWKG